ncbi:methylated in normal thymocytes [Phyllostomus discolor]|uniref:Methylated in normal thymocytes n=1 Tax=Phyllostomus discolor TaxID=89673 RepID=A0A833YJ88_9CHIR|nr:methylated in normal thymocytes [Phyllostomus discolor]
MVPAAGALLWALLLSLGPPAAAGAQGLTSAGTQRVSFRSGGTMTRRYRTTPRTGIPPKRKVIMEDDEDDVVANADRLAGPAAAELLASTVSTDISRLRSWERGGDGSLEEGVMINAQKNNSDLGVTTTATMEPLSARLRPSPLHLVSPSPALLFWRQVRTGLEDIWNSLSSVFTKMQPIDRNRR